MKHGASHPLELVERAASLGQPALGLTDRDGVYGAVKFVLACQKVGISPILGVDLAFSGSLTSSGIPAQRGVARTPALPHRIQRVQAASSRHRKDHRPRDSERRRSFEHRHGGAHRREVS